MPDVDDVLHMLSALLKYSGAKNIPVVDVRYDLDKVGVIVDPSHFLCERWELYEYVHVTGLHCSPQLTLTFAGSLHAGLGEY